MNQPEDEDSNGQVKKLQVPIDGYTHSNQACISRVG